MTGDERDPDEFRVVVLTCGDLGVEVAGRITTRLPTEHVLVLRSPYRQRKRSVVGRLRHRLRMDGVGGLVRAAVGRLRPARSQSPRTPASPMPPNLVVRHVPDFHSPEARALMLDFAPDLGVVAGTYILEPDVFTIPRLGSINLHSGKAPEYRGAAPAFWEMFNGESEVGITIHQVEASLDSGVVYAQECFPLDPAPAGDPLGYIQRYRQAVLRPHGVRMLAQTVFDIMSGSARGTPQDTASAQTYRSPTHRHVKELRRRVNARRREGTGPT